MLRAASKNLRGDSVVGRFNYDDWVFGRACLARFEASQADGWILVPQLLYAAYVRRKKDCGRC